VAEMRPTVSSRESSDDMDSGLGMGRPTGFNPNNWRLAVGLVAYAVRKAKLLFARGSQSRELKAGTLSFSTNELILLREDPEARTSIGVL